MVKDVNKNHAWIKSFPAAITVCDINGIILDDDIRLTGVLDKIELDKTGI